MSTLQRGDGRLGTHRWLRAAVYIPPPGRRAASSVPPHGGGCLFWSVTFWQGAKLSATTVNPPLPASVPPWPLRHCHRHLHHLHPAPRPPQHLPIYWAAPAGPVRKLPRECGDTSVSLKPGHPGSCPPPQSTSPCPCPFQSSTSGPPGSTGQDPISEHGLQAWCLQFPRWPRGRDTS